MIGCGSELLRALTGALMAAFALQIPPEAAYLVVDLPSGREVRSAHPEVLSQALLPGSIAKVAVLAAALETGVVTGRTALPCRGLRSTLRRSRRAHSRSRAA